MEFMSHEGATSTVWSHFGFPVRNGMILESETLACVSNYHDNRYRDILVNIDRHMIYLALLSPKVYRAISRPHSTLASEGPAALLPTHAPTVVHYRLVQLTTLGSKDPFESYPNALPLVPIV